MCSSVFAAGVHLTFPTHFIYRFVCIVFQFGVTSCNVDLHQPARSAAAGGLNRWAWVVVGKCFFSSHSSLYCCCKWNHRQCCSLLNFTLPVSGCQTVGSIKVISDRKGSRVLNHLHCLTSLHSIVCGTVMQDSQMKWGGWWIFLQVRSPAKWTTLSSRHHEIFSL